ncbi:vacuolar membrane protein-domain-containing protein [Chytridium lagenaria]|nr:vacuolar membrane protein-domain-containing protein [Chytridium lagenaria]
MGLIVARDDESSPAMQCKLMDGFAVIVQAFLATIALSSLVYKRHREHPRRPVVIWFFDSKQAIAAGMVHFANVAVSYLSGHNSHESNNPCILLDTTVGVGILYVFLKILHGIAEYLKIKDMKSGHYGNPPRISAWFRQLSLFITAWFFVKVTVVLALQHFHFLRTGNPRLQVLVVMLIFPLIMNIIQAWLIDMVIKGRHVGDRRYLEDAESRLDDEGRSIGETSTSASMDDDAALLGANDELSFHGSREPLTPVEPEYSMGRNRLQDMLPGVPVASAIAMTPPKRYSPVASNHSD